MKIHLVVAHPEKESFNLALHHTAMNTLSDEGISFSISDLYGERFDPVAGRPDVFDYPSSESFNLAKAQRWALENNAFEQSIVDEQSKLKLVIFWFSSFLYGGGLFLPY